MFDATHPDALFGGLNTKEELAAKKDHPSNIRASFLSRKSRNTNNVDNVKKSDANDG